MTSNEREQTQSVVTVHAHVRPALVLDPVDAKLETLRALEADGVIDELQVHAWPGTVPVSADSAYGKVLDAVERFRAWAEARDVALGPAFETHTVSSAFVERDRRVLRTPVMCLAVYAAGRLVAVYPHDDGAHRTVEEAIAAIRTGEFAGLASPAADGEADSEGCPNCGRRLANVQGLPACPGCSWTPLAGAPGAPAPAGRSASDDDTDAGPPPDDRSRTVE